MSYPDLPHAVKAMLADERHRTHHHLWHFVRNEAAWNNLTNEQRAGLAADGWAAPRFDAQPGSGIDFLGMHRQMIGMVNRALGGVGDPNWESVAGWDPLPWEDDNADWPVPNWQAETPSWASDDSWAEYTGLAEYARSAGRIAEMQQLASTFQNDAYLKSVSIDQLGIDLEWSIHGWMHMRWSGAPAEDAFAIEAANDWLFFPWSSHVSKTFWKLHGWIDDRISQWEAATGETADLSKTWAGPPAISGTMPHMADVEMLRHLPSREDAPMPMLIKEHIVEGLLDK